jgi:CRISPR-associated endonuclease/helicase Cas3
VNTELFVGGRRVFEREEAAQWLRERGFIAGTKVERSCPAFLFATSAGEVGVDLDADDMVCDLVAWERMVQRLGRVNRRGDGDASVIVLVEPEPKPKKAVQEALAKDASDRTEKESKAVWAYEASIRTARALAKPLDRLQLKNGAADASTGALRELKLRAETDLELRGILDAATTPAPLRPALSRALVDAWSMTSLKEHTGRPEIDPWLRGWIEDDPPQTSVVWRTHLPVRAAARVTRKEIEAFFEAAPPHASEILETETYRVVGWLTARAKALAAGSSGGQPSTALQDGEKGERPLIRSDDVAAVALTTAGDLRKTLRLKDLALGEDDKQTNKTRTQDLERFLAGATLIVDARMGG